jgi:hypothetical protein
MERRPSNNNQNPTEGSNQNNNQNNNRTPNTQNNQDQQRRNEPNPIREINFSTQGRYHDFMSPLPPNLENAPQSGGLFGNFGISRT